MPWCMAVPFNADPEIIINLEDKAHASVIPKLCIFSVEKGFEKCVVMDVKHILLKNEDQKESYEQVMAKVRTGEETFDMDSASAKPMSRGTEIGGPLEGTEA